MDGAKKYIALSLQLLGICVLLVAILKVISTISFNASTIPTKAEVLSFRGGVPLNSIKVEYVSEHLGAVTAQVEDLSFNSYKPGDRISIRYNPDDGQDVTINSALFIWLPALLYLLVGIVLTYIGYRIYPRILAELIGVLGPSDSDSTGDEGGELRPGDKRQLTVSSKSKSAAQSAPQSPQSDTQLFGPLISLINDPRVSDIVISKPDQIAVRRGNVTEPVNIRFAGQHGLDSYVDRLLTAAGTAFSVSKPIADGNIGSHIRVHAVNSVLCDGGPYLTIRISRFQSIKDSDLVSSEMINSEMLSYLRAAVSEGHSILIGGEVGTGKTTILRALASCIAANESILVIEDTREIKIEHPHVRYVHTREANVEGFGKVQPSDCIRASMRMSMDRVIFGEIRDPDAAEAFIDVCSSGHAGLTTFHARSSNDAINRLRLLLSRRQPGLSNEALSAEVATAIHLIVMTALCKKSGRLRVKEIVEIGTDAEGAMTKRSVFRYNYDGNAAGWLRG